MTEAQKDDLSIIFSEDRVKDGDKEYVVKPWTLKQLMGVWPLLSILVQTIQVQLGFGGAKTLSFSDFTTLLSDDPQTLIQILLPHIPKFLSLSINGVTEEDAENIDAGIASVLVLKVISRNIGHLKNSLSLVVREVAALTEAMKNTTQQPSLEQ